MGFYDKTDAREMPEGVWTQPDGYNFQHCYNASEAFEQAVFDGAEPVGKVLSGFTTFPPSDLKPFGLKYRVKRIADVDSILDRRKAKRESDAKAREQAKKYESVTTLTFDRDWKLTEKTVETRTVYTNKSGGMRIKTRSNGSPVVHNVNGNYVVVNYPHPIQYRDGIRFSPRFATEIPAECPVLDNV